MSLWMRRRQFLIDFEADSLVDSESDYNLFVADIPHMFDGLNTM